MYWFLYRDRDNEKGLFYDWNEANLKYCLNAKEAEQWYEERKQWMVTVNIKRPPDLLIPVQIPLQTKPLLKKDIDTNFLRYIIQWNVSTRMELVLNKFMDNYYLWLDWCFYRRDSTDETMQWSWKNTLALIMMKDVILGNFRISPIMLPDWKSKNKDWRVSTQYAPWDIGSDMSVEYVVQGEKYKTNLFWIYTPKLYDIMLPNSNFEWRRLQKWQMDMQLNMWRINYVIGARSSGKSLIMTGMAASTLLKEVIDDNERLQEFAVLYMGLSVKQNAPYINYSRQMLDRLFTDNIKIVKREDDVLYPTDWDQKRSLEFITTNQADPARSRRTRFAIADEADYLDWDKVKTLIGTPNSIVTLISTIDPKTQAGQFYRWWKNAYNKQRWYEPVEVLIHRIWTEHNMHQCKSRKDIERKIKSWEMAAMRAEFLQARPEVALHYTIDDLEFLSEADKASQNDASMAIWWYEYMLAENYWEYATNDSVFTVDWLQGNAPLMSEYAIIGYDEAENYDDPALAVVMCNKDEYWAAQAEKLPKDPSARFARMKEVMEEYKRKTKWWAVFFAADISRSESIARELWMLWMPVDMQIRWWGNSDFKPSQWKWLVNKQWCIQMIQETFMTSHNFHFDTKCYDEGWLIDQISHFKRKGRTKVEAEHSWHDDQVSALMACLFYLYQKEQLWVKLMLQGQRKLTASEMREKVWHEKYQKEETPSDKLSKSLLNLKNGLF